MLRCTHSCSRAFLNLLRFGLRHKARRIVVRDPVAAVGSYRSVCSDFVLRVEELSEDVYPEHAYVHDSFPRDRSDGIRLVPL